MQMQTDRLLKVAIIARQQGYHTTAQALARLHERLNRGSLLEATLGSTAVLKEEQEVSLID
jgi:hypothetical protein